MPLVIVAIGVILLLLLMIRFKMNGFIALVLVALAVGLMQGMPLDKVIGSIKAGVGGTLGSLALIMGFGAMLGKMLADCGGAQRIATTLIAKFGKKHIQWAVVLTGFTVGFALFYEVGFVLMLPLVFTIAASANIPLLYVGVPMAAALSVTHGFLPPHPGPTAIATIFNADMGKTLLYGTILAIPTVILAGPVYARVLKGIDKPIPEGLYSAKTFSEEEMPSFGVSVWTSLVPVVLMAMRAIAIGVILLLLLMIRFKMNGFIALVLVALAVGLMQGMPLDKVIGSIKAGVGGTLGSLALIMGFGAMLGKMLADCGGAQRIATTLIAKFGKKHIQWAVVLTGFTVGFALFYEVGFVLMLPLVFTIAASANIPLLYVGVPMAAALSVTHGFLPPHPGPTAIATIFNADMGKTLLYGTILAIPTVILAGPVYARVLKGIDKPIPEGLYSAKTFSEEEMPSFGVSVWTSLVPVVLMAMRAIAEMILPKGHAFLPVAEFLGDPVMATLIAVLIAMFTFGLNRGRSMDQINDTLVSSIKIIAMMLLIIGGGGAFKQVLVDSGVDKYIASMMHETNISPLLMAWSIAAVLRIALGSATVAAITAGGIAAPLIATTGVSPELMVIAVGSGSVIFSHVNDPGFWLFKEYFNLTIGETIKSWSMLETIISVCGLVGCLLLNMVI